MRKLILLITVTMLFGLIACESSPTDYSYEESGFHLEGLNLYFRMYSEDINCSDFDYFLLFNDDGSILYSEAFKSLEDSCSSALYVKDNKDYVELIDAFDDDIPRLESWIQSITAPIIIGAKLESEIVEDNYNVITEIHMKKEVLFDANMIVTAAIIYCTQELCENGEELTYAELTPYIIWTNADHYDFTNNSGIIATLSDLVWLIDLEKNGTGEFELTQNSNPLTALRGDVIIDVD